ncbi:hypothetical protein FYK55_18830 [Roseiconus nitratireducens]|uniref:Uncharacterized protein n=1 Tax=Roseiconus nitratireducens TaxID=2605748 RepID=A0A5M6D7E8_9BACT|nr:hypothetical protein FYK55_18830 [Roseiconus nitratireducens]
MPVDSGDVPVPAFRCVVYVSREGAQFKGRVANLPGIEATGNDQRELLGRIVPQFKSAVSQSLADGNQPAWIDPPMEKLPSEQKLFLPVHL